MLKDTEILGPVKQQCAKLLRKHARTQINKSKGGNIEKLGAKNICTKISFHNDFTWKKTTFFRELLHFKFSLKHHFLCVSFEKAYRNGFVRSFCDLDFLLSLIILPLASVISLLYSVDHCNAGELSDKLILVSYRERTFFKLLSLFVDHCFSLFCS